MQIPIYVYFAVSASVVQGGNTFLTESTSSSSLPSIDSFVFDGTNSDIAQQLYIRHHAGDVDDKVALTSVPTTVSDRLDPFNIVFDDLPGLVQRAVLWDAGFAISPTNDAVQIWTIANYTMANIAVPKDKVSGAGCTFKNCSQPNDVTAYYTRICSGDQMLSVSRCVVDTFVDSRAAGYLGVMWARGGDPDMAPMIRLREHSWTDPVSKDSYSLYAVHTAPSALDATWDECPANNGYGALAVPCYRRDKISDKISATMQTPTGSDWVTTWLKEDFAVADTGSHTLMLALIIAGVVLVLVVAVFGWFCWRRKSRKAKVPGTPAFPLAVESPPYCGAWTPDSGKRPTDSGSTRRTHQSSLFASPVEFESAGSNTTLKILLDSQYLQGRRIPYESLSLQNSLSRGANGEVWTCDFYGKQVAAKRLKQRHQKAESVQAFAEEIELSATLSHPNIVDFIGVAWNSLNNLTMVLEFLPRGNLQDYLHKNADLLSWARDKVDMAIGIAKALKYLHGRTPAIIHRDLKSNNVLLTDKLEPKLIDFGVSRDLIDFTMTAGVGTPYWTAPEILEGKRYTEQADIYSFGVVLSELDTGKIPYHDALTENGGKAKPLQILQDVMLGSRRPTFSLDCPPRIQRVGSACLAFEPSNRPTASQLIQELRGNTAELVYSF